ncbi:MAG: PAS domain-containing protein [Phycisphaerae bacterium]|nr:PAS domain-containing protein [Phycisphaerae bacterium]
MRRLAIPPSGREVTFGQDEIIVSKTDLAGVITYANDVFQRVSGFSASELVGQPHNLIRHPDMPRCVFKLLWDTLSTGQEIFAYVINQAKNGDHYWVFAHVTPSYDAQGRMIGYHSSRRVPYPDALPKVRDLYKTLRGVESSHSDPRAGIAASFKAVVDLLQQNNISYGEFVFSLSRHTTLDAAA